MGLLLKKDLKRNKKIVLREIFQLLPNSCHPRAVLLLGVSASNNQLYIFNAQKRGETHFFNLNLQTLFSAHITI